MIVTGVGLTPDCSGNYEVGGLYNGVTYYQRCDLAYYIWNDGMWYFISAALGDKGIPHWEHGLGGGPTGDYDPGGGAAGTATVAAA